jgi:uncharacterized protein YndB with AHSA1/START domain
VATIRRSRTVQAPAAEIWAVVTNPDRLPDWWPSVQRVEEVNAGAWTNVLASPKGKAVRADYTLVESEPERRLVWRHEVEESPFERLLSESLTEIELEPRDERATLVELTIRMRPRGFARFGSIQLRRATGRQLEAALAGLESAVGDRET